MPGGQREAWEALAPILRAIAAKADDGEPCVEYMGPGGAGHYVKMVHNGIEYGDMQLIAETLRPAVARARPVGAASCTRRLRASGTQGELKSYLIEITAEVLGERSTRRPGGRWWTSSSTRPQQKGTGKWTSQNALDVGAPIPTINAAVESRIISALKTERVAASRVLRGPSPQLRGRPRAADRRGPRRALREQDHLVRAGPRPAAAGVGGVRLRPEAGRHRQDLARRAASSARRLLGDIMAAYRARPRPRRTCCSTRRSATPSSAGRTSWRFVVQTAVGLGIPVLAMSASLAYFDAYRSERLPANLTQAPARLLRRAHVPARRQARRVPHRVVGAEAGSRSTREHTR